MKKSAVNGRYVRGCMTAAVQETVGRIVHDMSLDNPPGEQCREKKQTVKKLLFAVWVIFRWNQHFNFQAFPFGFGGTCAEKPFKESKKLTVQRFLPENQRESFFVSHLPLRK